jgi:hypothetical protein
VADKFQVSAVVEWKKRGLFPELLPEDLRNVSANDVPDVFLITDPDYKAVRDALMHAWISGNYERAAGLIRTTKNKPKIWSLALHHLTQVNPCKLKDPAAFEAFLSEHGWLDDLRTKAERPFRCLVNRTHRHGSVHALVVHFREAAARLPGFLQFFSDLTRNPARCEQCFFPTMEQGSILQNSISAENFLDT